MIGQLIKRWVRFINFLLYRLLFSIKTCWNGFYWNSFCHPYKLITYNYCIANNTFKTFTIFTSTSTRIPNIIFFAHILLFQSRLFYINQVIKKVVCTIFISLFLIYYSFLSYIINMNFLNLLLIL